MRLPKLEGKTGSTELNRQFLGYRHVDAPDEGAFYEMENVTSERYPLMAPRSPRAKLYTLQNPGGLCAKTALAWTENGKLYYGGEAVADVSEGEKTFVSMGAWLIVFPDGVRYNTADGTVDAIGQKNVTDGTVNFTLCEADGTAYSDYTVSETEPEDTTKYWLCTGSDPHCLKKYSAATKLWNTIPTTYVMISAAGIGKNLAEGDTVTVSGVLDSVGADLNGEMLLQQAADDAVVVVGFLDETASQTDAKGPEAGLCGGVQQPAVGVQQRGKRDLRLQAGRRDQLELLCWAGDRQLHRERGQRRAVYRRGSAAGVCAVF